MRGSRILSHEDEPFEDAWEAGRLLANELQAMRLPHAVVLGIPRGGVIVASQIAGALGLPMDILLSHKIGYPGNPEAACGAVTEYGQVFLDQTLTKGIDEEYLGKEARRQLSLLKKRSQAIRKILPKLELRSKTVIITDDGVARGFTMLAGIRAARERQPLKIIAAIPIGPEETVAQITAEADETLCLRSPRLFFGISQFYKSFRQIEEEELFEILKGAARSRAGGGIG